MKRKELNELIRAIARSVLREFMNVDPTSNSDIHKSSSSTAPNAAKKDGGGDEEMDVVSQKKNAERALKDLDYKRKAKEAENQRNQQMVKQYNNVDKPMLLKQRQMLQKQLRGI
jgi:hypothetical protein